MEVTHEFVSEVEDDVDDTLVRPSNWNADHVINPEGLVIATRQGWSFCDEGVFNSASDQYGGYCVFSTSGSGAGLAVSTSQDASHWSVMGITTGTATTGRSVLGQAVETVVLGSGEVRCMIIAKIPTLSDGTNRFTVRMGFSETFAGNPTDGVQFRYVDNANSGKWLAVATSNTSETPVDTGVTANTSWHRDEIVINAAGTSAEFFIDGSSVATINSGIPTGTTRMTGCQPASIIKSAGGSARTLDIDAYWYSGEFTTPR